MLEHNTHSATQYSVHSTAGLQSSIGSFWGRPSSPVIVVHQFTAHTHAHKVTIVIFDTDPLLDLLGIATTILRELYYCCMLNSINNITSNIVRRSVVTR